LDVLILFQGLTGFLAERKSILKNSGYPVHEIYLLAPAKIRYWLQGVDEQVVPIIDQIK